MRVQFNGRTPAFQAGYVGSIPITRFFATLFYEGRYVGIYGYDFLGLLFRNHQENR